MQPGSVLVGQFADVAQWVEGAGIDVAGLGADQGRALQGLEQFGQAVATHPTLRIGFHPVHGACAESEVAQGYVDRDMRFGRSDQVQWRSADQPIGLDIPADAAEQRMPGRRQAGEIRHLAAGDEAGL